MIVDCAVYRDGERTATPTDVAEALEAARAVDGAFVWIGLYEPTEKEFDLVSREFTLHPLAVEDALSAHQRPKLEVYEGSLFLVLKPVAYDDARDTVSASELMVFVGNDFVVTVRHGEAIAPGEIRQRLEAEHEVLKHGPGAVMYAISDTVVDDYIVVAADLQADLEELEAEVFAPEPRRAAARRGAESTASRIYAFKRQLLEFRRAASPLMQPMIRLSAGTVPHVASSTQPFFRDVADHLTRANELVDGLDRLLSDILGAHLTQVGVRQNDDMRKISAWAAMAAVPTMITGVYGMNFEHMPELRQVWGYPAVLAVIVVAEILLYRTFKRHDWL
ncbi:magnesium and cobalt transport protein CorA [Streptomyces sp. MI02-7b]|uniref:magnesium and cobalt transport protein CorA n=1 Tax=Streptomyces sp. MI02-7b TaxID=462941 RepID=UPI0029B662DC|nr:magnesium and cobalt transport protein CorA [Streptomyces sp. MI02-7b]MDX3075104.1 magnesium and cobalt transport protein CorA [Streptomyces sp. MI02-7b]